MVTYVIYELLPTYLPRPLLVNVVCELPLEIVHKLYRLIIGNFWPLLRRHSLWMTPKWGSSMCKTNVILGPVANMSWHSGSFIIMRKNFHLYSHTVSLLAKLNGFKNFLKVHFNIYHLCSGIFEKYIYNVFRSVHWKFHEYCVKIVGHEIMNSLSETILPYFEFYLLSCQLGYEWSAWTYFVRIHLRTRHGETYLKTQL